MDHDKIESVLKRLRNHRDDEMSNATIALLDACDDLIRSLRTEIDNQETRIADLEQQCVEVWHRGRKVTVYHDQVIRVWGSNMETEMSDEPRTLDSVGAAFDWLYQVVPNE